MRRYVVLIGAYIALALVLGLAFSWLWTLFVLVGVLLPAGLVLVATRLGGESHLEWSDDWPTRRDR